MSKADRPNPRPSRISYKRPSRTEETHASDFEREEWDTPEEDHERPERLAKIAGLQAVSALFKRDPERVIRLYFEDKMKKAVGPFCSEMARQQKPYRLVEPEELEKISGTVLHGGVVAAVQPRKIDELDTALIKAWARAKEPLLIVDGVGNPHNLGAIARTLAFFGLKYLLISDHPKQTGLSDAAHRVAEGGLEYLHIYRVHDLPLVCEQISDFYRVVGTALNPRAVGLQALEADNRPIALILGNEEAGVSPAVLRACEDTVMIRGGGAVQSLNVSATAAILIHQLAEGKKAPTTRPKPTPGRGAPRPQRPNKPYRKY